MRLLLLISPLVVAAVLLAADAVRRRVTISTRPDRGDGAAARHRPRELVPSYLESLEALSMREAQR